MPLYFAYGSCMNAMDLARTVQANEIGSARLFDYKLAFTRYSATRKGGVADVVESIGDYVEGMLFWVPDFKGLDAREGHPYFYQRKMIELYIPSRKEWVYAYTYEVVQKERIEVKPTKEYALLIWDGAKRLSKEYREILKVNLLKKRKKYNPNALYSVRANTSTSTATSRKATTQPVKAKTNQKQKPVYKTARLPFDWDEFLQSRWDMWVHE